MSLNRWVNEQSVAPQYNEILSNHKKEWSTDTLYNVNEPWKRYAKWKKTNTKGHLLYYFFYIKVQNREIHKDKVGYGFQEQEVREKWQVTT